MLKYQTRYNTYILYHEKDDRILAVLTCNYDNIKSTYIKYMYTKLLKTDIDIFKRISFDVFINSLLRKSWDDDFDNSIIYTIEKFCELVQQKERYTCL